MPWTIPLSDPAADVATAGGKRASLVRLARAGLPVPEGFHLTTAAYRAFTSAFDDRLATEDRERITTLFAESALPEGVADEVADRCTKLGNRPPSGHRPPPRTCRTSHSPDRWNPFSTSPAPTTSSPPSGRAGHHCGPNAPLITAAATASTAAPGR